MLLYICINIALDLFSLHMQIEILLTLIRRRFENLFLYIGEIKQFNFIESNLLEFVIQNILMHECE